MPEVRTPPACADAGPVCTRLFFEAPKTLAVQGQELIKRRVRAVLAERRREPARTLPGPEELRPWLEDFALSVCRAVSDDLTGLLAAGASCSDRFSRGGPVVLFDAAAPLLAAQAAADAAGDPGDFLRSLFTSLTQSQRQAQWVDRCLEFTWTQSLAQLSIHPLLRKVAASRPPHRAVLRMLAADGASVADLCRNQWRRALCGLLDHLARRLTSELSMIWAKQVFACHDITATFA